MRHLSTLLVLCLTLGCGASSAPPPDHPVADDGSDGGAPARSASLGDNTAVFQPTDPTLESGAYAHRWSLPLRAGQRVLLRMTGQGPDVDPLLTVRGPGGVNLRNDDGFPGTLDSIIEVVAPEDGTFEITASTYAPRTTGPYLLRIREVDVAGVGEPYALGQRLTSQLGQHTREGFPGSWIRFEGQGGSIVRLRVTSQAFDTIATLMGPGGQVWTNDDANDLGPNGDERALDSTIVAALPTSGTYHLVVTPYGGQGAGPFQVRSTVRAPVTLTEAGERPEGLAGQDGGGRLLGLYVGITAYAQHSPLYGCADDARLLAEAMRAAHLQDASDQMVLPDSLGSREGFQQGAQQLARMARPQDVVVVFFSGHGQQVPDDNGDEMDGLDETIVFFDGALRDDEVVAALAPIQAETVILALDSCHSGGFADDWVQRPGRVGVFSSDEDVLSDVAEPHQAGGYLSWHLRRGVLGEADARPRDGVLYAGELTDYLLDGFVADHGLMNPSGEVEPSQRLVVRRGAVTWDQVLWVYPRGRDLTLPPVPSNPLTSPPP